MKRTLKDRLRKIRKTHEYRLEKVKLEFVQGITRVMALKEINNAELARRLDTTPAYVTKVMRGDTNFTLDSLVKITHALDSRVHIHVADSRASVRWLEAFSSPPQLDCESLLVGGRRRDKPLQVAPLLKEEIDETSRIYA